MSWFLVKTQYNATAENGKENRETRLSLIDGILYGEIEERTHQEISPFSGNKDIFIADIRRYPIQELIDNGGDIWFRMQVIYVTLDDKAGVEKETKHYYLVSVESMIEAQDYLTKHMEGTLGDWKLGKIETTKIMDVFA